MQAGVELVLLIKSQEKFLKVSQRNFALFDFSGTGNKIFLGDRK
jgi:hypothetical protein